MTACALSTDIVIRGTPMAVWAALTDFSAYAAWNPFIVSAAGTARTGERLAVTVRPPGRKAMSFKPRVLEAEPGRSLRWKGHVLVPGLLDGEHAFRIDPAGDGTVRLIQAETFTGLLARLAAPGLPALREGFGAMNRALKARVEGAAA